VLLFTRPPGESFRERYSRSSKPDFPNAGRESAVIARLVRHHPETSYWQGDANEMAAINTILIIVNNAAP
jgi:hypothetical protein